jgi:hypothetical protein
MKKLFAGLALLMAVGCGGSMDGAKPVDPCVDFDACIAQPGSAIDCIDGECACMPPTHPGENRATACPAALAGK